MKGKGLLFDLFVVMPVVRYCIVLPEEVVESPFLDTPKPHLDRTLSFVLGLKQSPEVPSNINSSMIHENNSFVVRQLST